MKLDLVYICELLKKRKQISASSIVNALHHIVWYVLHSEWLPIPDLLQCASELQGFRQGVLAF